MTFLIKNKSTADSIVVSGDTVEEIQQKVQSEIKKRNWKEKDCWSKELD